MSLTERDHTENSASRHHSLRKNLLKGKKKTDIEKQTKSSFQKQQNKNCIHSKAKVNPRLR